MFFKNRDRTKNTETKEDVNPYEKNKPTLSVLGLGVSTMSVILLVPVCIILLAVDSSNTSSSQAQLLTLPVFYEPYNFL